jgi:DegV family protein with EDD domain
MTSEKTETFAGIDGITLYNCLASGARRVIEHKAELNEINIFPVNNRDTGTNLAATMEPLLGSISPHRSYKITVVRIADAMLHSSCGTSGIIFAQMLQGLSRETSYLQSLSVSQFIESLKKTVGHIATIVAEPAGGTILTVMRDWFDAMCSDPSSHADFGSLMSASLPAIKKSLYDTTLKVNVLMENNVPDAGAKAFVLFVEGIAEYFRTGNKDHTHSKIVPAPFQKINYHSKDISRFRYCTEAVIKDCHVDRKAAFELLKNYGDSIAVAGNEKAMRIHLHTSIPAVLFSKLRKLGTIILPKADDMFRNHEIEYKRKWSIALVTDSTCDLDPNLMEQYQINMIPSNIYFGENHYLDKLTIQPEQFYKLINEDTEYPHTDPLDEKFYTDTFTRLIAHYDSVIAIHSSSRLSGIYYSSLKAANFVSRTFGKTISVIDSRNTSGGLGLIVLRIAQAIEWGYAHHEIISMADKWVKNTRILVSVITPEYIIKSGRMSPITGMLVRMMNLNPIVSIDTSGKVILYDKTYSSRTNMGRVISIVGKLHSERKLWNYVILHSNNDNGAQWFSEKMVELTGKKAVSTVNVSTLVGTHVGIGGAAVALLFD